MTVTEEDVEFVSGMLCRGKPEKFFAVGAETRSNARRILTVILQMWEWDRVSRGTGEVPHEPIEQTLKRIAPDALYHTITTALEELQDWRESARRIAEEQCGDEKHCTCVTPLRKRVAELEAEIEELEAALNWKAPNHLAALAAWYAKRAPKIAAREAGKE